jgi:hypothetical protein
VYTLNAANLSRRITAYAYITGYGILTQSASNAVAVTANLLVAVLSNQTLTTEAADVQARMLIARLQRYRLLDVQARGHFLAELMDLPMVDRRTMTHRCPLTALVFDGADADAAAQRRRHWNPPMVMPPPPLLPSRPCRLRV